MKKVSLILVLSIGLVSIICAQTVKIGSQVWMTKNLDVSIFRNGDPIPEVKTAEEWKKAGENKQPAWCYYQNDPANGVKYGKLYNWYAVIDSRGLAPVGYHIPTDKEWTILTDYLGGKEEAGAKMKSKNGWDNNGNGTNSSGFSGVPGGLRFYNSVFPFYMIGESGDWWSSTEGDTDGAFSRNLDSYDGKLRVAVSNKQDGLSVRCLKD